MSSIAIAFVVFHFSSLLRSGLENWKILNSRICRILTAFMHELVAQRAPGCFPKLVTEDVQSVEVEKQSVDPCVAFPEPDENVAGRFVNISHHGHLAIALLHGIFCLVDADNIDPEDALFRRLPQTSQSRIAAGRNG